MKIKLGDWYSTFEGGSRGIRGFITKIKVHYTNNVHEKFPKSISFSTIEYESGMIYVNITDSDREEKIGQIVEIPFKVLRKELFAENEIKIGKEELYNMIDTALDARDEIWFMDLTDQYIKMGGINGNGKAAHSGGN